MSLIEKARGCFTSRAGSTAGGHVGGKVEKALKSSPESLSDDPSVATNTEQLVGTAVVTTALRFDAKSEPAIKRALSTLMKALGAVQVALADGERHRDEGAERSRLRRLKEQDGRQGKTLADAVDHAAPLLPHRVVTCAEILLALVESGFWYLVFSDDIDRRVPLFSSQRLAAVGLAVFIPALGILAARFAGPAWQRYLRYPASEPHVRRNQTIAALLGLAMVATAGIAAWNLVSWRYSKNNPTNTFAVLPPAWCMALLFVGSVVTLALLRAFSDSEQHAVNAGRDKAVATDSATRKQVYDRAVNARVAWVEAWTSLRLLVDVGLDEVERIVATGEQILLFNRGRHADASFTQPQATGSESDGTTLSYHLAVNLITTRLRVHATAVQMLGKYDPDAAGADGSLLDEFLRSVPKNVDGLNDRITALLGDLTPSGERPSDEADTSRSDDAPAGEPTPAADADGSGLGDLHLKHVNGYDRVGSHT